MRPGRPPPKIRSACTGANRQKSAGPGRKRIARSANLIGVGMRQLRFQERPQQKEQPLVDPAKYLTKLKGSKSNQQSKPPPGRQRREQRKQRCRGWRRGNGASRPDAGAETNANDEPERPAVRQAASVAHKGRHRPEAGWPPEAKKTLQSRKPPAAQARQKQLQERCCPRHQNFGRAPVPE